MDWKETNNALEKDFVFKNFQEAFAFNDKSSIFSRETRSPP